MAKQGPVAVAADGARSNRLNAHHAVRPAACRTLGNNGEFIAAGYVWLLALVGGAAKTSVLHPHAFPKEPDGADTEEERSLMAQIVVM